jgi:hypothetical protein
MAAVSGSRTVSAAESTLKGRAELDLAEGQWREGLDYTLNASDIQVSDGDISGKIAGLAGNGRWSVRPSKEALTSESDVTLRFSDAEIRGVSGIIALSGGSLTAAFQNAADRGFSGGGEIAVSGLSCEDLERQIKARGINGRLPLQWPVGPMMSEGRWTVETIQWKGLDAGSFQGDARQNASGLIMEGAFTSRLLPGYSLDLSVETGFSPTGEPETAVRFRSDPYALPEGMDLGRLLPKAGGVLLDGELAINGGLSMGRAGPAGWMGVRLSKAALRYPAADISIEDIDLDLVLKDLFSMRSAPKQRITFKKASLGALVIDGGEIDFQMESSGSFLIEKSRFQWCGGKIETQAMRIAPGTHDYDLLLYCDRLNFAGILNQFGASSATGTGTLTGRIPIRFHEGGMTIHDGFLFSTPGEGGKISLSGSDFFTALMPTETLRISHMEIAREALKDYEYNWAKLTMTMEEDILLLKLQLDGKPAGPLPFLYKQDQGKFIKIEAAGKGSIFQGIRLDINFRLPADKILYYGDLMRKIFKLKESE